MAEIRNTTKAMREDPDEPLVAQTRAAAGAAADQKLAPTVTLLQESVIALYDVLIAGEWPAAA